MTHITQHISHKKAEELAERSTEVTGNYDFHLLCNAAIDHYLSTLSAELPEPACVRVLWPVPGGGSKWIMSDKPLLKLEGFLNEDLFTRDKVLTCIAARDAKWQPRIDHAEVLRENDRIRIEELVAERDAALQDAKRYRFIRDVPYPTEHIQDIMSNQKNAMMDSAIDHAMKGEQ